RAVVKVHTVLSEGTGREESDTAAVNEIVLQAGYIGVPIDSQRGFVVALGLTRSGGVVHIARRNSGPLSGCGILSLQGRNASENAGSHRRGDNQVINSAVRRNWQRNS